MNTIDDPATRLPKRELHDLAASPEQHWKRDQLREAGVETDYGAREHRQSTSVVTFLPLQALRVERVGLRAGLGAGEATLYLNMLPRRAHEWL
jgi:hypothetical protein